MLLSLPARGQLAPSHLKPDDTLPPLAGQALSGKWVDLPASAAGKPAVVIFSFSRAAGRDAHNWTQHLSKDDPRLSIYTVIFLESVPRLIRGMVVSGIKSQIPTVMQDRTILLYQDERSWKQRLHLADESHACVTLVRENGKIQWMNSESFVDVRYSELTKQIRALR
jgi:hypothetical protein